MTLNGVKRMIKYRTQIYSMGIEAIEVMRETPKMVVYENGLRESKRSDFHNWHDTWEDAHRFLITHAQKRVDGLRLQLELAEGGLYIVKHMKPPKE